MGPHPAVAAIRLAVRRVLHDIRHDVGSPSPTGPPPLVLVACSGGADSMALASALAFEAPRGGLRAGGVTVDHGLQSDSDVRAREVAERLAELGLDPVERISVTVGHSGGPEAAARTARYAALDAAADRHGAVAVLLGHTRDDQAETVLLGLARGSGTRSLAGMAAVFAGLGTTADVGNATDVRSVTDAGSATDAGGTASTPGPANPATGAATRVATGAVTDAATGAVTDAADTVNAVKAAPRYRRPFLAVDRQTTRRACLVQSIPVWDDPHNSDPSFTRSRVRHEALPVLEKALGRGVVEALARTAQLSRDDADALDAWAGEAERAATGPDGTLEIAALRPLPPAVRRRVLRRAAIAAGAPAGSLFARHIEETDRLITAWRGQRPLNLPGRVEASRQGGRLVLQQANGWADGSKVTPGRSVE